MGGVAERLHRDVREMNNEIARRRTFAIISHPDAGKTTLTEKFLLFGGQIQVAGAVKSNKIRKTATSDWMDIEKQRGISVSTSVMEFDYEGYTKTSQKTPTAHSPPWTLPSSWWTVPKAWRHRQGN